MARNTGRAPETEAELALLLLARYGEPEASHRALPKLSQEVLAEMVGTTRSRVNFFMNKFRKLGFIVRKAFDFRATIVNSTAASAATRRRNGARTWTTR